MSRFLIVAVFIGLLTATAWFTVGQRIWSVRRQLVQRADAALREDGDA